MSHQIKCEHCGEWTDPSLDKCTYCGKTLREEEKKVKASSNRLKDSLEPQLITINDDDHPIVKLFKRVVQLGQMIFYAIITFLVWVTSWTIG